MPRSQAEVRAAHATLQGANTGMSQAYAKEVVGLMHGKKMSSLPEHATAKSEAAPAAKSNAGQKHWSGK